MVETTLFSTVFKTVPRQSPFDAAPETGVFSIVSSGRKTETEVAGICQHDSSGWNVGCERALDRSGKSKVAGATKAISLSSMTPCSHFACGPLFGEEFFVFLARSLSLSFDSSCVAFDSSRTVISCMRTLEDFGRSDLFWPVSGRSSMFAGAATSDAPIRMGTRLQGEDPFSEARVQKCARLDATGWSLKSSEDGKLGPMARDSDSFRPFLFRSTKDSMYMWYRNSIEVELRVAKS